MTIIAFNAIKSIPESAQCVHGPHWWTMSHPTRERFELRFPAVTPSTRLGWWIGMALLVLAVIIYTMFGVLFLWPRFSWDGMQAFAVVSLIFWGCALHVNPFGRMFTQELIIDTETGMMTGTALVIDKSVVISAPIAAVTEVKYFQGTTAGTNKSAAEIGIHFDHHVNSQSCDRKNNSD